MQKYSLLLILSTQNAIKPGVIYALLNLVSIGLGNGWSPRHYLNQCWLTINSTLRNKRQWNLTKTVILRLGLVRCWGWMNNFILQSTGNVIDRFSMLGLKLIRVSQTDKRKTHTNEKQSALTHWPRHKWLTIADDVFKCTLQNKKTYEFQIISSKPINGENIGSGKIACSLASLINMWSITLSYTLKR